MIFATRQRHDTATHCDHLSDTKFLRHFCDTIMKPIGHRVTMMSCRCRVVVMSLSLSLCPSLKLGSLATGSNSHSALQYGKSTHNTQHTQIWAHLPLCGASWDMFRATIWYTFHLIILFIMLFNTERVPYCGK